MLGWILGLVAVVVVGVAYTALVVGALLFLMDTPEDK